MNRQARLHCISPYQWEDYGDVTLLEAARLHAAKLCTRGWHAPIMLPIEVRCQTSPEIRPAVFEVQVDLVATVLNPRLDTDTAS